MEGAEITTFHKCLFPIIKMKNYLDVNKKVYDQLAIEYEKRRENHSKYEEKVEYLGNSVLKYVYAQFPINVLEIGPGAGQMLAFFEKNNCRTIGIELSKNMAQIAKKYSPNSVIINENVNDVNLEEDQMHLVYMGAVIHLFPIEDAEKLLLKVWRWLKKDGIIFVNTTCHDKSCEGFFVKKDYTGKKARFRKYWTEIEFEKFVRKCGFHVIDKLYTDEKDRGKKWVAIIGKKI